MDLPQGWLARVMRVTSDCDTFSLYGIPLSKSADVPPGMALVIERRIVSVDGEEDWLAIEIIANIGAWA